MLGPQRRSKPRTRMGAYLADIMSPRTRREKYLNLSLDTAGTVSGWGDGMNMY